MLAGELCPHGSIVCIFCHDVMFVDIRYWASFPCALFDAFTTM